ncbi:MAG: ferrous iron transport protein B [Bacteroidota bacterium]|nr:ferrous iron transport protein B [Bacteroidota bacterium]
MIRTIALVGNPNSGKTTIFNALTGLRQKVGNYPGVTVEKKQGTVHFGRGQSAGVLDLPGLYSLTPHSPDEAIAREVLLGLRNDTPKPDLVLSVVDATNLDRNLYTTRQLLELGVPVIVVLTMTDLLEQDGQRVNTALLSSRLGVPVCEVVASRKHGLDELKNLIATTTAWAPAILGAREHDHHLFQNDLDHAVQIIEGRYTWIAGITDGAIERVKITRRERRSVDEKIDRVVMHPVWGYVIFLVTMAVLFQAIFSWVQAPMDWIRSGMQALGGLIGTLLPAGDLRDLLQDGLIAGVGNTLVFLPQILLLFFFITLLEDTGYMARAAFLMDRLMSRVGLHGKSFIPLVSSFACAIPGIMATRTIGDRKARLITILVAPLMSCSARLPVYALMIGAFIPVKAVLTIGPLVLLTLPGLVLLSMYFLGMIAAFTIAWLFHRTLIRGEAPTFVLELPSYHAPHLRNVLLQMLERAGLFLRRAGTVILSVSIVLWALATYPKHEELPQSERAAHSFVGVFGHAIEPAIAPLGFNWKMGIGMISSFVAREVFVSAMGTVYSVGDVGTEKAQFDLQQRMKADTNPASGAKVFTPLVAISLMVYYVLAMQCISTLAVVRRETNSWKWPLFQLSYMTVLAWVVTFAVYHGGKMLGLG